MKLLLALAVALLLVGCKANPFVKEGGSTRLMFDKDFNLQFVDPTTGKVVTPTTCGRNCRVFNKENVLVDFKNVSVTVNQFSNPHCCYTFDYDGVLSEYCWTLPPGTRCPPLR